MTILLNVLRLTIADRDVEKIGRDRDAEHLLWRYAGGSLQYVGLF